jgi:hypothetical protein
MRVCRYLCVICYPGQEGCRTMQDDEKCEVPATQRKRAKNKSKIKVRQMPTVCRYTNSYSNAQ